MPIEAARAGWGRISIANADSGAYAYAHSAMVHKERAVRELLGAPEGAPEFSRKSGAAIGQAGFVAQVLPLFDFGARPCLLAGRC